MYMYSESLFNTPQNKITYKRYKDCLTTNKRLESDFFFRSPAPTYHNFIFNLQFFYELRNKFLCSKSFCGAFYFLFRFVFIKF